MKDLVSYEPTLTLRIIPLIEKPNRLKGHTCLSGIIALTHSKSKTVIGIGAEGLARLRTWSSFPCDSTTGGERVIGLDPDHDATFYFGNGLECASFNKEIACARK